MGRRMISPDPDEANKSDIIIRPGRVATSL